MFNLNWLGKYYNNAFYQNYFLFPSLDLSVQVVLNLQGSVHKSGDGNPPIFWADLDYYEESAKKAVYGFLEFLQISDFRIVDCELQILAIYL